MTLEEQALAIAADPRALRKRLQDTRSVLTDHFRRLFGKGRFDFAGRRLIGDNGLILQWQVRQKPDAPVSYHNQQTSRGIVFLEVTRNE